MSIECSVISRLFALVISAIPTMAVLAQPADPIISMSQQYNRWSEERPASTIDVFADGQGVIYRAPGMRNSGTYSSQLPPTALRTLVSLATSSEIVAIQTSRSNLPAGNRQTKMDTADTTSATFEFNRNVLSGSLHVQSMSPSKSTHTIRIHNVLSLTNSTSLSKHPLAVLYEMLINIFGQTGS